MNQELIAHIVISVSLLIFVAIVLIFVPDQRLRDMALIIIPLIAGFWLPSPTQKG